MFSGNNCDGGSEMKDLAQLLHEFKHEDIVEMARELESKINGTMGSPDYVFRRFIQSIINEGYPVRMASELAENAIKTYALSFLATSGAVVGKPNYVWYEHAANGNNGQIDVEAEDKISLNYYLYCLDCHKTEHTATRTNLQESSDDVLKRAVSYWNKENK